MLRQISSGNRRNFIRNLSVLAGAALGAATGRAARSASSERPRSPESRYMGGIAAPKIKTIRFAFVGVGSRGSRHARQLAQIEGTEIVAICDLYEDLAKDSAKDCEEVGNSLRHQNISLYFGNPEEWRRMLRDVQPDAVVISTPWKTHAAMAIGAMEHDAHAFVEVPIAVTLNEMWDIVDTSERTRKHCMMLENANYGREELLFLNMCRLGVIGELLHGDAAYIHDLRHQLEQVERGTGSWRTCHYAERNGNLYPTHGLGPIAQYMNLARSEDTFDRLVSYSSPARCRQLHAAAHYPPAHKWNQLEFQAGDINTSIVKTRLGRTIMVQWDENSPRPYTRHNLIQGTKGTLAGFPTRIALDSGVEGVTENAHDWVQGEQLERLYEKYDHPLYRRLGALSKKMGGHGGMDFMMRKRVVECLRNGEPLDQNVYEGCFWSAVGPLSETSVAQGGAPQKFPDFTRGQWKETEPLAIVS